MGDFFVNMWKTLVKYYDAYSAFVHSILPNEAGDFAVILIDAVIVIAIVKLIADTAFKTED